MIERKPVSDDQIESFRAGAEKVMQEYFAANYPTTAARGLPVLTVEGGPKYARIVKRESASGSISAHCFIERETGDILKPAGWKAPAKHARGNINTPTSGVEFVGPYGAAYLR